MKENELYAQAVEVFLMAEELGFEIDVDTGPVAFAVRSKKDGKNVLWVDRLSSAHSFLCGVHYNENKEE